MNEEDMKDVINHLLYFVKYNGIKNAVELEKFIYTRNFSSEEIRKFKELFKLYGEKNVYNCIISYSNNEIKTKEELIQKIKGVI